MNEYKRTKMDEEMERAFGEILKAAWENRKQLSMLLSILLPVAGTYLWTEKRAWLDEYIPTNEIERAVTFYFPKIIMLLIFLALLLVIRGVIVAYWNRKNYRYTLVLPHSSDGITAENLHQTLRNFHGSKRSPLTRLIYGKERFSYVIHYREKDIVFYLGAPEDRLKYLKTHLSSLYARVEFHPADKIVFPSKKSVGGRMKTKRKKQAANYSFAEYKADQLPIIFNNMQPNTWIQIAFSPNNGRKLEKEIEKQQRDMKKKVDFKNRTYTDREELHSLDHRMAGNKVAFDVTVSLATEHYPGVTTLKSTGEAIGGMMAAVNELKYRRWRYAVKPYPTMAPYKMIWTSTELANLVHLPHINNDGLAEKFKKRIPHNALGQELLPYNVLSNEAAFLFGYQLHPFVKDREVRVMPRYLGEHWVLTGENGSGKSTLVNQILKSFIDEFIKEGISPGFSFIDPARDTALIMLNYLMTRELREKKAAEREGREPNFQVNWEKVKWISFRNTHHPPALNLLHKMEGENEDLAADQIFKIIKDAFDPAPQTERLLKMSIRTLMADPEETHTILGIRPLLYDEDFRKDIMHRVGQTGKHRDIVAFWNSEAEKMIEVSAVALLNRLDVFYSNKFLQRVFGQKDFSFPVRKWMDEGFIVLYDFSGMSEDEIGLVGSYLSYLYYRVADTRDAETTPLLHQFVVDEAHKVKANILKKIVYEQRKKGLSLGAITQDIYTLPEGLYEAMTEVTGNFFACKQGAKNAKLAASAFTQEVNGKQQVVYSETFFRNLIKMSAAIKIIDKVDGVEKAYQTVVTVPPLDRYLPNGEVATFGDKVKIGKSIAWTLSKAEELQSNEGLHEVEIDKVIEKYLYGESDTSEQQEQPKAKKREQKDLFELMKENDASNDAKRREGEADDLPLENEASEIDPPLDKDELQQALDETQAENLDTLSLEDETLPSEDENTPSEDALPKVSRRKKKEKNLFDLM